MGLSDLYNKAKKKTVDAWNNDASGLGIAKNTVLGLKDAGKKVFTQGPGQALSDSYNSIAKNTTLGTAIRFPEELAKTMYSGTNDFFKTAGGAMGEKLAYTFDPNVRKQYESGNTDILPVTTNVSPLQMMGKTVRAMSEVWAPKGAMNLARAKAVVNPTRINRAIDLGTRVLKGAAPGYAYDVSNRVSEGADIKEGGTWKPGMGTGVGALFGAGMKPTAQMTKEQAQRVVNGANEQRRIWSQLPEAARNSFDNRFGTPKVETIPAHYVPTSETAPFNMRTMRAETKPGYRQSGINYGGPDGDRVAPVEKLLPEQRITRPAVPTLSDILGQSGEALPRPGLSIQDVSRGKPAPKIPTIEEFVVNGKQAKKAESTFSSRVSETEPKVKPVEYTKSNNNEVVSKAQANMAMGADFALKQARNDSLGAEANATAMSLVDDAIKKENWDMVDMLVKEFSPRFSKQGQEIQILSRWGRLTPSGAINYTQHLIDKAKQASNVNIDFTPEAQKEIVALANAVQKTVEGTRERAVTSALLMRKIVEQIPSSIGRKISTIQTMGQLLNPKTAIRNIGGNLGFLGGETISDVVGTPIDMATSIFTGKRTKTLPSLPTIAKGFFKGLREGGEEAVLGIDTKNLPSQFDLQNTPAFTGKIGKWFEKALGIELKAADRAFYQATYDESLRQQIKLSGAEKSTPEMLETAHFDGLYRTFQDESNASKLFVMIKRGLNIGKDFGLGDLVLKYPKTPGNLIARAIDYSPAGYAKGLLELIRPAFKQPFNQKAFVEDLSRGTVGTAGLIGLGAILGKLGVVSGQPSDDKDINNLEKSQGKGPFRLNMSGLYRYVMSGFDPNEAKPKEGDNLMTYDWFQPFAVPISMGANMVQKKKQAASSVIAESLSSGVETLAEQPLVSGMKRLFGYGDIPGGVAETVKGAPASFIPTFLSQIRQFSDNQKRQLSGGGFTDEMKALVLNKIPGLEKALPKAYTTLGQPAETYQNESNTLFNVFFNPAFLSTIETTPGGKEVLNIFEKSGETQQAPRTVPKSVTVSSGKIELSPEQISRYQEYIGTKTNNAFNKLVSVPEFQALSDEEKAKYMAGVLTDINTAAKIELFGHDTQDWREKKAAQYMNGGMIDYASDLTKKADNSKKVAALKKVKPLGSTKKTTETKNEYERKASLDALKLKVMNQLSSNMKVGKGIPKTQTRSLGRGNTVARRQKSLIRL